MFRELQAPIPGSASAPRHHLYIPPSGVSVRATILSPRPVLVLTHWVEPPGRTVPCTQPVCHACRRGDPKRKYAYAAAMVETHPKPQVLVLTYDVACQIFDHKDGGAYWRGVSVRLRRSGSTKQSELYLEGMSRVIATHLAEPWDVRVDLLRVWRDYLPEDPGGSISLATPPAGSRPALEAQEQGQ